MNSTYELGNILYRHTFSRVQDKHGAQSTAWAMSLLTIDETDYGARVTAKVIDQHGQAKLFTITINFSFEINEL